MRWFLTLAGGWLAFVAALSAAEAPDFERDAAPLLVNRCLLCHQPSKRSGGLDLSSRATALAGGESGPAISAERPEASYLLARVADGEMPPPGEKESQPLSAAEKELLKRWVQAGAKWPEGRVLGIHERTVDLEAARQFWSFWLVVRPPVPVVQHADRVANPVDAFVWQNLEAAGLEMSPPAAPRDLVRRMSLDLRGIPPSLQEQEQLEADGTRSVPATFVDRFLADPAYGERWARHWLDLVRYADSNGYERDQAKLSVWRYRDYVIAALNSDKPYDQFVLEQIAGDELEQVTDETLIATGFHALGAWQDEVDPLEAAQYRADELDDMVRTTSQTFLGLTLGCARCHNHKFDPLTMVDYYSLVAILAPLKRPNKGRIDRDVPLGTPDQIAAVKARDEELARLDAQMLEIITQKPADAKERSAAIRQRQRELRQQTPDRPGAYRCYEDGPEAPPTYLLLSGRASNPGPLMQPRVPAVLTQFPPDFPNAASQSLRPSVAPSSYRRLTLGRWIVSPDNPLTARVIVNRVWQHHFGTGLVATPSDFGQMGARPTHPELLDWLAHWFVYDADWSLKKLHRLIVTSETYQQSSQPVQDAKFKVQSSDAATLNLEPGTLNLYSHFPYRRLDVEAIRDSMLAAAGNLDRRMYGPAVMLPIPAAAIEAHTDKQAAWKAAKEPDINRRTVYAFVKRTLLVPMLETLDFCDTTNSTDRRAITSIAPQALTLFNGDFTSAQAEAFARRLEREAAGDERQQIDLAYRAALARPPTAKEMAAMIAFLEQEAETTDEHAALVQACRVILNLNEFVYPN